MTVSPYKLGQTYTASYSNPKISPPELDQKHTKKYTFEDERRNKNNANFSRENSNLLAQGPFIRAHKATNSGGDRKGHSLIVLCFLEISSITRCLI